MTNPMTGEIACPHCAEPIKAAAKFCKHCRSSVSMPPTPAQPATLAAQQSATTSATASAAIEIREPGGNMPEKKQNWIALLLNFLFPGAGHMYAGQTQKGVALLIGYIVCFILLELVVPAIGVIGIWIYAMATSTSAVEEHNAKVVVIEKQKTLETANSITPGDFTGQITKFNQLLAAGIINQDEFAAKKLGAIQQLAMKKLVGDADDLLLALAPLKQVGVLTDEEVKQVKQAVMLQT